MSSETLRLRSLAMLFCLLGAAASAAPNKEPSKEIEAKVALESSLEKRLQSVLREALGSDDLIVIVNVALRAESERAEPEVLPGVPTSQATQAESSALTLPMVSRLSATIIIDQGAQEKDVDLVKKIASGILGVSKDRGDSLNVEKIKFHKPQAAADPLRFFPMLSSILWLLCAATAVTLFQKNFLGPFVTALREVRAAMMVRSQTAERVSAQKEPSSEMPETTAAETPKAAHISPDSTRPPPPFSFVENSDLPKLVYILRKAPAATTAVVIHYMAPALAAKTLAEFPAELRREIIALLSKVNEMDEDRVRPIEEALRKRINYLVGGEDKLAELLESLPTLIQRETLETLRNGDADLATRVSRKIVFIDDIATLEPAELKLLARRVPAKVLATVLKSSEQLKSAVLPKLAAGMREWLIQEMDLSRDLSPENLEAARQPVLSALSQLVREGWVVLRKTTVPAPAPSKES